MVAKSRGSNMQDREWWVRQGYRRDHPVHGMDTYVRGRDDEEAKILEEDNVSAGEGVRITVAPTRTSNPGRPRTVAAGYNYDTDTLRVVFREGAVYDYFDVSTAEWQQFRRSASPGRYISRRLSGNEYIRVS